LDSLKEHFLLFRRAYNFAKHLSDVVVLSRHFATVVSLNLYRKGRKLVSSFDALSSALTRDVVRMRP
jgi:hypothetical protein